MESARTGRPHSLAFAIVSIAILLTWAGPGFAQPTGALDQAKALFAAKKFPEAIALLDTWIAAHARDAVALVLRGDSKADLVDNEGALKDYDAALAIDPDYQYAYVTRCETRLQVDNIVGALADCTAAIRLLPTDGHAYEDRGDVQFQRDRFDLALADYDKAIELGRSSAYVYAARCDSERLTEKLEHAAVDCATALHLDPASRRGLWARGRLALTNQRYADAIPDLSAYIAQNPKSSDTGYYFRGLAYNHVKKYALALADLQVYVLRAGFDPDGYRERAVAQYGLGNTKDAASDLDLALAGYEKSRDSADAARIQAMIQALKTGQPLR
jgi:tetratricopeptide (TPR) repeat protein